MPLKISLHIKFVSSFTDSTLLYLNSLENTILILCGVQVFRNLLKSRVLQTHRIFTDFHHFVNKRELNWLFLGRYSLISKLFCRNGTKRNTASEAILATLKACLKGLCAIWAKSFSVGGLFFTSMKVKVKTI